MNPWLGWMMLAVLLALGAGCASGGSQAAGPVRSSPGVRHVVLFKFKAEATSDQIHAIEAKFRALKSQIPQILDFEWGTNMSPENRAEGFTHCFLLTFQDSAARDTYLPHPAHKEFGTQLRPILEKVLVVDYVARD